MMVQEETSTKRELICLIQVKAQDIEYLLSETVREGNIHLKTVESSMDLNDRSRDEEIIAFIIGSEVQDPIQSAQRLHAFNENAAIVMLAKPGHIASLNKAVKFSPFIGVDVFCFDVSDESKLEDELNKILANSRQAARYRDIVAEANPQISFDASATKTAVSQRFINKLMDTAPIGIAIVGKEGKLLGWNKEAASIFKKSEAQVLATPLSQLFSEEEGLKLKRLLRKSSIKRMDPSEYLTLEREQDNSIQHLSLTAAPFTFAEGTEKALILTIRDVTERKQAQLNLEKINATLEERVEERTRSLVSYQQQLRSLASQLSKAEEKVRHRLAAEIHDNLGQMLAVNKIKVESLQQRQLREPIASEITEIEQGVDEALSYARDLMADLKPPPSLDKEDITATIEWVAKKVKKHDLEVLIEDDGQPKRAREDVRITLLQCVREALYNVIHHADTNKAWLELSRIDDQVKIVVEDKGKGFDPEQDLTEPGETSGYGLFNIRERMDLLGGAVEVESEPNQGTRVKFFAPLKK